MNNKIINTYKKAWESHSLEYLSEIFHEDICYQEHTDNLILGIDALKSYWVENSNKQSNVTFKPIKTIEKENEIVLLWEAEFFELIKNKFIKLQGIMWLTIVDNKVIDLKEFFEYMPDDKNK